jgi:CHRD domain
MKRRRGLAAAVVGVISIALVFALAGGATAAKKKKKTYRLNATLSGSVEVPPGDLDASGTADFKLVTKRGKPKGKVCADLTFQGIDPPTAAHIHPGGPGETGAPAVPFFEGSTPMPSPILDFCVKAKRGLVKDIGKNPGQYYVNLHNGAFPAGALRGQLQKKGGGGSTDGGGGGGGGGITY